MLRSSRACASLRHLFSPSSTIIKRYSTHSIGKLDDATSIHHTEPLHPSPSATHATNKPHHPQYIQNKDINLKKYSHLFANPRIKAIIDRIVRVDQAGEFGAARMYLNSLFD
jgi:hypothetical protein